jgi:predicted HicB family RNase H-like nuclease
MKRKHQRTLDLIFPIQLQAISAGRILWSETMINVMTIEGFKAVIAFDPDIQMFRGEFVGLNGGADFYAADVEGLKREGAVSLRVFLEACTKRGIEPRKHFSGKFVLRLDPETHEAATVAAAAAGQSLNQWAQEALRRAACTEA